MTLSTVDAETATALRNAVRDCSERGLLSASKWSVLGCYDQSLIMTRCLAWQGIRTTPFLATLQKTAIGLNADFRAPCRFSPSATTSHTCWRLCRSRISSTFPSPDHSAETPSCASIELTSRQDSPAGARVGGAGC